MENTSQSEYAPAQAGSEEFHHSKLHFPVVGIGASAGGLQALLRFFRNMPDNNGMAFVVILHLSPTHESNAAEIIQNATDMRVQQVSKATLIEANRVYVIPPNKQLSMDDNHLNVTDLAKVSGKHVPIDLFFRTLADVHQQRAFGIVLSGVGADGAVGMARIKEQGGVTFAQAPEDAEYDGMPRSAIEAGIVDFVLPAEEIAAGLVKVWENAKSLNLPLTDDPNAAVIVPPPTDASRVAEEALQEILLLVRKNTGHDFRHYKRATIIRRVERRLQVCGLPDLPSYRDYLNATPEEAQSLLQDLLIGVTNFFRDYEAFDALEKEVIPKLFEGKQDNQRVRVWVTACSTGEEAYSLAILLSEFVQQRAIAPAFQVFATDVDQRAIGIARAGLYPQSIETDLTPARLRQFFFLEDRHLRVRKPLRDRVLFAPHDLLKDSPFSKLDLITCRNLLIYLNRDIQARLLELFHFALNPGGYLFLGSSETADAADHLFAPVDKKHRIYRAKELVRGGRALPTLPMSPSVRYDFSQPPPTPNKPKHSFAHVHQRALTQFAEPSVVVDRDSNIVHISEDADRFLRYIGGEPSRNLPALVLPELRLELRTTLFQATQSGKSIRAPRVRLERDGRACQVGIVAHPFHDKEADSDFILVVFNEFHESELGEIPEHGAGSAVATQLEEELRRTKEQLQQTIERSEVSTEELKASNEELQAINEELRSTTEELETSKEELQSVNEELVTVNYELKTKVEEASKVNDDLNNLIASTDIATIFVDSGIRIKRYTPAATSIFNIIPADVGRSLLDITHRLDYDHLAKDAAATFESLLPIERELRSNGGRIYIMRMLPYRTTDDRIGGAVLTFVDITSRHEAEERVRSGERRIKLFAESTKDYAIITSDAEGVITSWNKGAERIFGYEESEAIGRSLDLICLPEDVAAGVPAQDRKRAREEGRVEDERWHVRKDGTKLFCSGMLTPLQSNEFFGYASILRDVTERLKAEARREAQMARERAVRMDAQATNELKDQFLAVMSHELKQPLNLVHISAEMLMRLPEIRGSVIGTKAAKTMQKAIQSQAKIIDDLLDLSRLSTGKLALSFSSVDLAGLINTMVDVAKTQATPDDPALSVSGTGEPLVIRADPVRLEQVLWNLLSNAMKFTPAAGAVSITVSRDPESVTVEVEDDGDGIDPAFLPHVFDIYKQAGPATTRSKGGLGIGLSLVKQLVGLHGGDVHAASPGLGKGARFTVKLPLHPRESATIGPQHEEEHSRIAGLRIMLVDDSEEVVLALTSLLELEGAKVMNARSAGEALEKLEANEADLLISDIAMPGMDGYELMRQVRMRGKLRGLPAIAVTGLGRPVDIEQAMAAGFSAHISKPVSIDAITDKVIELGVGAPGVRPGAAQ